MKRIAMLFVLAIAGGYFLSMGCSDSGQGKEESPPPEPPAPPIDINEGPKSPYFLYSASDGKNFQINLLNPKVPSAEPAQKENQPTSPSFKILKLTEGETNSFNPQMAGAKIVWQADNGAKSDLAFLDVSKEKDDEKFRMLTKDGTLGKGAAIQDIKITPDGGLIVATTDTDGRFNRSGIGILSYNTKEEKLQQKGLGELLGITDAARIEDLYGSISDGIILPDGSVFQSAYPFVLYSDTKSRVSLTLPSGEIKIVEDIYSYPLWRVEGGLILRKSNTPNEMVLGRLNSATAQFEIIGSLGSGSGTWIEACHLPKQFGSQPYSGNVAFLVSHYVIASDNSAYGNSANSSSNNNSHDLFVYKKTDKTFAQVKSGILSDYSGCMQDESGNKAVFSSFSADKKSQMLNMIDIASGKETTIFSLITSETSETTRETTYRSMRLIDASKDMSLFALSETDGFSSSRKKNKLLIIDASGTTVFSQEAAVYYDASFLDGANSFVFKSDKDDSFVVNLAKDKTTTPLSLAFFMDFPEADCGKFLLLRKQSCPVSNCQFTDSRASSAYSILNLDSMETIEIQKSGPDLDGFSCVMLTEGQYKKYEDFSTKTALTKLNSEAAGAALYLPMPYLYYYKSSLDPAQAGGNIAYNSTIFAISRVKDAAFSLKLNCPGLSKDIQLKKSGGDCSNYDLKTLDYGIWQSRACGDIDIAPVNLPDAKTGDKCTLVLSDGASTVQETLKLEIMEPPPPPEPADITFTKLSDGPEIKIDAETGERFMKCDIFATVCGVNITGPTGMTFSLSSHILSNNLSRFLFKTDSAYTDVITFKSGTIEKTLNVSVEAPAISFTGNGVSYDQITRVFTLACLQNQACDLTVVITGNTTGITRELSTEDVGLASSEMQNYTSNQFTVSINTIVAISGTMTFALKKDRNPVASGTITVTISAPAATMSITFSQPTGAVGTLDLTQSPPALKCPSNNLANCKLKVLVENAPTGFTAEQITGQRVRVLGETGSGSFQINSYGDTGTGNRYVIGHPAFTSGSTSFVWEFSAGEADPKRITFVKELMLP